MKKDTLGYTQTKVGKLNFQDLKTLIVKAWDGEIEPHNKFTKEEAKKEIVKMGYNTPEGFKKFVRSINSSKKAIRGTLFFGSSDKMHRDALQQYQQILDNL
jgi:hypothetical protein